MRTKLQKAVALILVLVLVLVLGCTFMAAAEEDDVKLPDDGQMDLDIIFVLDASGSMLSSDPNKIALDAFNLFVDLCDESCGVGYTVYTEKIKASSKIVDIKDDKALSKVKQEIASLEYDSYGDTDIALGLTNAMKTFSEQKKADAKKNRAIILLSDGNTHLLNGPRTLDASKKELQETLTKLNEMNIPVYTIGLNYDGTLDKRETENIASSTGGKSFETKSSSELTGITSDIFSDIYKIEGTKREISKEGNVNIIIKDNSVFYVNVIIRTQENINKMNPVLRSPSNVNVPLKNNPKLRFTSTPSYALIKLIYPESGIYTLHLDNADNTNCTVTQLDFYSVYVNQTMPETAGLGEPILIKSSLQNKDAVVDDIDLLNTMKMVAIITRDNGDRQEIELQRDSLGYYSAEFTPVAIGNYTVYTSAITEKFSKESEKQELAVGVTAGDIDTSSTEEQEDIVSNVITVIGYVVAIGAIIAVIIVVIIFTGSKKQKKLVSSVQSVKKSEPVKPKPVARPAPKPQVKEPEPERVEIPIFEHESLDKIIKKGTDDAFATKSADEFETDVELEKLIKKGSDDPFHANADSYEVDPALAALIKTGGDGLSGGKIEPAEETDGDEEESE